MHPTEPAAYENIKVLIRIRPPNSREKSSAKNRNILKIIDNQSIIFDPTSNNNSDSDDDNDYFCKTINNNKHNILHKQMPMTFDYVYTYQQTNFDIFQSSIVHIIDSIMIGYNCCTFVYGATGAGKTFTMLGNEHSHGLVHLTCDNLFQRIQKLTEQKFTIAISYIEIYNEHVMNLLIHKTSAAAPLKLQENNHCKTIINGLQLIAVNNVNEIMSWLIFGNRNRTQHPTDSNAESSRSHAIFQVHIRCVNKNAKTKKTVKLSMIDLAGSERAAGQKCEGIRFKEGATINKSLLALGNCINKLADGASHIPYRDSNLTRIIKDSLGGNCQTIMIANVSPSSYSYEDTYNTLKYAVRAKKIRTVMKLNVNKMDLSKKVLLKKLTEQNSRILRMEQEIHDLRAELEGSKREMIADKIRMNESETISNECFRQINDVTQSLRYATDLAISREKLNLCTKIKKSVEDLQKFTIIQGDAIDMQKNIDNDDKSIEQCTYQIEQKATELQSLKMDLKEKELLFRKMIRKQNKIKLENQLQPLLIVQNNLASVEQYLKSIQFTTSPSSPIKPSQQFGNNKDILTKIQRESNKILNDNYLLLRCTNRMCDKLLDHINVVTGSRYIYNFFYVCLGQEQI